MASATGTVASSVIDTMRMLKGALRVQLGICGGCERGVLGATG